MQDEESSNKNSELFIKKDDDEVLHVNACESRLFDLIRVSLDHPADSHSSLHTKAASAYWGNPIMPIQFFLFFKK